ncbi:MAG TPA: alpha/beta hydrolase [Promineifilum sp.]|nr:alpha/beta hydrolase [Promineifilum sp.]
MPLLRLPTHDRLAYIDTGPTGGSPLLLIHGFTGTATADLGNLIAEFAPAHRLLAPDLRGYGQSRPPNRDFPPDFYERDAVDMAALLDAVQPGPVVVLGFSDGAEVALLLAAARPDLVRGVVAWGVSGVISPEELAGVAKWLPATAWGPEREQWKQQIITRHGAEQFPAMVEGWVAAAQAIAAAGGNICYQQAANIACPVLLLNGDGEEGNTPRDVRRLAERIPGARLEFVSDSGHAIHRDRPDVLLARIRAFLAEGY